jgi:hypothetical protein
MAESPRDFITRPRATGERAGCPPALSVMLKAEKYSYSGAFSINFRIALNC